MNEMNDTNERQVTNTCTHTDDGSVCAKCLGVDVADKTIATLTAERDAAIARAQQAEADAAILREVVLEFDADYARIMAEKGITERGVMGVHISDALASTTAGADLLAKLTRLRKLEAWARDFVKYAPVLPLNEDAAGYRQGGGDDQMLLDRHDARIAVELRALLENEASDDKLA